MNILNLLKKTQKKKSSSLDLRKTQSSPVIIIRNTPTNLKPILTNHSNLNPPNEQDETANTARKVKVQEPVAAKTTVSQNSQEQDERRQEALAERLREIRADDMELLLSMETQARMDHQAEQQEQQSQIHPEPSKRLKFALPDPPPGREPSPPGKRWSLPEDAIRQELKKKSTCSPWTRRFLHPGKSDPAAVHPQRSDLRYGCKVKLIRSPIKTTAYVRYIGPVHFAPGEWIGVELERAVGKTDGSVDGQRYFYTGAFRGSFLTKDELMLV